MSKKLVVSINGGGDLIVGPAQFAAQIEEDFGDDIEIALACGASAGSLYVSQLIIGKKPKEIKAFLDAGIPEVFHPLNLMERLDLTHPKWDSDGLRKLLEESLGKTRRCCDVEMPFCITASNFTTGDLEIFTEKDTELLVTACLASAAATTFFAPLPTSRGLLADGGFWCNNTALVGSLAAHNRLGIEYKDMLCLSLTTSGNYYKNPKLSADGNLLIQEIDPMLEFMLHASDKAPEIYTRELLHDNYLCIGPNNPHDFAIDDLSQLNEFRKLWNDDVYVKHGDMVKMFLAQTK
jgi:patatin-like phospholipase/acyl hydrolase